MRPLSYDRGLFCVNSLLCWRLINICQVEEKIVALMG